MLLWSVLTYKHQCKSKVKLSKGNHFWSVLVWVCCLSNSDLPPIFFACGVMEYHCR